MYTICLQAFQPPKCLLSLIFRNKQKILEQNLEAPEPDLVKNIVEELERVCK